MDHSAERRAIVTAVFAVTGKKVDEDDPIIVAALFQAYTMRDASREAADHIAEVGKAVKQAVADARLVTVAAQACVQQCAAAEKNRSAVLEARITKAIREAGRARSNESHHPAQWRGVIAGAIIGVFVTGLALSVACGFSFSWISDARIGAEFRRVVPTMDPSLRDKLMEYLEKRRA